MLHHSDLEIDSRQPSLVALLAAVLQPGPARVVAIGAAVSVGPDTGESSAAATAGECSGKEIVGRIRAALSRVFAPLGKDHLSALEAVGSDQRGVFARVV
jgi:hypothetical protein